MVVCTHVRALLGTGNVDYSIRALYVGDVTMKNETLG